MGIAHFRCSYVAYIEAWGLGLSLAMGYDVLSTLMTTVHSGGQGKTDI